MSVSFSPENQREFTRNPARIPRGNRPRRGMAYYSKTPTGKHRAQIEKRGQRISRTFDTKREAREWAAREETIIVQGARGQFPDRTVREAMSRYAAEVSSTKRGRDFEVLKMEAFVRDYPALADKVLHTVETPDLVAWRDARLKTVYGAKPAAPGRPARPGRLVTKGTVQREINLFRAVWTVAAREWKWCAEPTPWRGLKSPGDNPPRDQRIGWRDSKRLLRAMGFRTGTPPLTKTAECAWAFLVSLRTGMRAGEVLGLRRDTVDLANRVVRLDVHKTVEAVSTRFVPVQRQAGRLLSTLAAAAAGRQRQELFTIDSASLDALFRKMRNRVGLRDIHFHDARAEALTRLARRVDVMTLARISGHRDLKVLMHTYYRETPEEIARRL